jgi:hypothetical protein
MIEVYPDNSIASLTTIVSEDVILDDIPLIPMLQKQVFA